MELFLEPSGDSLFPLPKRTIKSQRTRTYTRSYNYEKLKRDLSSWRIYGGGSAMFVSARIVFSEKTRLPSKWWWAWREDGWKGGNWINRGIVKSVGSHRIVVTVKRSRLTTHGDCLTSSRLDWSWPAALCCTALSMRPCIPRKCIQPSLRQPHSCRMLDSANSSLPYLSRAHTRRTSCIRMRGSCEAMHLRLETRLFFFKIEIKSLSLFFLSFPFPSNR